MAFDVLGGDVRQSAQEILGYLNFSAGKADARFLRNLNHLYRQLLQNDAGQEGGSMPTLWVDLGSTLRKSLEQLRGTTDAFRRVDQADAVLRLVFDHALEAYRSFHADLLFHQTDDFLLQPLFIGRMCEAVLQQGGPWTETDRIVSGAVRQLNDYLGHRPVAVLRNERKLQPYPHERVRPVPLYIRDVGAAAGPYQAIVEQALGILRETDPDLTFQAWFELEHLEELAVDPRAYDFDHPVNKRPNYHFGQWDPHQLDASGYYNRFVLQQMTLDAMLARTEQLADEYPREELLFEAAAVLAGTMLMASGVSGSRPDSHDSSVTLATLLPTIAGYRDAFYEWLLNRVSGQHAKRLRREAKTLRQPFGGARQHLNQQLARARATQLQHVHLAHLFARMGFTEAAMRQAEVVPVASARIDCQILCLLAAAHRAIDEGRLQEAAAQLPQAEQLLHRGIECGALVDPWNILGFGAQFSLFPAVENTVHDYRVDELIELVNEIFNVSARLEKAAAAAGDGELPQRVSADMERLAAWWDQFASTEVSGVVGFSGRESWESAALVADALRAWHEGGTSAGDLTFWRSHVERFHSTEAYALVVESLLEQRDPVAAMSLIVQWLSRSDEVPLVDPSYSFHDLTTRWMEELLGVSEDFERPAPGPVLPEAERWQSTRKFLDYLEANAEEYWEVPQLDLAGTGGAATHDAADEAEERDEADDPDSIYAAAYEDVVYRDTTDDGNEGETLESGESANDFELSAESDRISDRLAFHLTLARLWKLAAATFGATAESHPERDAVFAGWLATARASQQRLGELMMAVHRYRIPTPRTTHESLVEYDRHRAVKENLLERILSTSVEMADAARLVRAAMLASEPARDQAAWEEPALYVVRALFHGDADAVRRIWPELLHALAEQPLLYVALSRGGNPQRILASRSIQRVLRRLLVHLPRLGLLYETYQLLETIQVMERNHTVGPGAITEFDQMFEIGCKAIAECFVESSRSWNASSGASDVQLIACLERTVEALLRCWLEHSRRVRLSVLESVADDHRWKTLREFIQRHGHDVFTQKFMNMGNLRAILHQGVENYLEWIDEEADSEQELAFLNQLESGGAREEAARHLAVALEAVVENYPEYLDYNSTTTQSDRGEMLYTLLDFLRLRANYDRVAWNLRPIILAHEVLVRQGCSEAAEIWRRAVAQRTNEIADDLLEQFSALCKRYGMRLPSIADRLEERFVRSLAIDRMRALVRPAMEELRDGRPPRSFAALEREVEQFTEDPSGVGFDLPAWLESLEEEVERVKYRSVDDDQPLDLPLSIPQTRLTLQDAERQVKRMLRSGHK